MSLLPLKFGLNTEFRPLQAVLLYKPGPEIAEAENPSSIQHLKKIDAAIMEKEYLHIIRILQTFHVQVFFIDHQRLQDTNSQYVYNLMYTRDLIFMTPWGAVICQMAGEVRRDEVRYAQRTLDQIGVPVLAAIQKPATCEGADVLWLRENCVIVGVGNRTNTQGLTQLQEILKPQKIQIIPVPLPPHIQHLLGILQLIDRDLALLRSDLADAKIKNILHDQKIRVIDIVENEEITHRQAMNIVTLAPRKILMPTNCPQTKKIYLNHGINVAAEIPISQLINGAGGLACATSILSRS
jgi:N-dimethylarginine dimethylaminohydrolase